MKCTSVVRHRCYATAVEVTSTRHIHTSAERENGIIPYRSLLSSLTAFSLSLSVRLVRSKVSSTQLWIRRRKAIQELAWSFTVFRKSWLLFCLALQLIKNILLEFSATGIWSFSRNTCQGRTNTNLLKSCASYSNHSATYVPHTAVGMDPLALTNSITKIDRTDQHTNSVFSPVSCLSFHSRFEWHFSEAWRKKGK